MNATVPRRFVTALGGVVFSIATAGITHAVNFTLIDGEGFEAPAYSTAFLGSGQLEGQFASTLEGLDSVQWARSPVGGTGQAVMQSTVVASGSQAVEVHRSAYSDDRWAVPITGAPAQPLVCIEWDMRVESSTSTPNGSFGPLFGVEAYDDDGTSLLRIGTLGVDAATGDVLYTDMATGLVESGTTVDFGVWYSYRMVLDFSTDTYFGFLNNTLLFSTDFESPGIDQFTDADIAAIAAGGDAGSQGAIGTAYFDNYLVFETDDFSKVPEPSSVAVTTVAIIIVASRRCFH
jgi:hypothetical protein